MAPRVWQNESPKQPKRTTIKHELAYAVWRATLPPRRMEQVAETLQGLRPGERLPEELADPVLGDVVVPLGYKPPSLDTLYRWHREQDWPARYAREAEEIRQREEGEVAAWLGGRRAQIKVRRLQGLEAIVEGYASAIFATDEAGAVRWGQPRVLDSDAAWARFEKAAAGFVRALAAIRLETGEEMPPRPGVSRFDKVKVREGTEPEPRWHMPPIREPEKVLRGWERYAAVMAWGMLMGLIKEHNLPFEPRELTEEELEGMIERRLQERREQHGDSYGFHNVEKRDDSR